MKCCSHDYNAFSQAGLAEALEPPEVSLLLLMPPWSPGCLAKQSGKQGEAEHSDPVPLPTGRMHPSSASMLKEEEGSYWFDSLLALSRPELDQKAAKSS